MTAPSDEMVDARGGFRSHWRGLLGAIAGLGWDELRHRSAGLDRDLREEGVPSLGDTVAGAPWRCDPIPLILAGEEFDALAAGLVQRASILQRILDDVYGAQALLATGALPARLVFGATAFLRPCGDLNSGPLLQLYAADLLRAPDGTWHVVADRTACPVGLAHALENRRLLARFVPEFFAGRTLRRLEPFLEAWQDALQRLAPRPEGNPGVALLGAGSGGPGHFEETVLARELSCTLVEGGDLTVRDGALYLKTLRGLARVHVLLRRLPGRSLDPLELDPDPGLGVAGLLEAARTGAVRIANHPGTGFAEMPALAAYLPALAPVLLGENLRLSQADTSWLGAPTALDAVLAKPEAWLLRSAVDPGTASTRLGALDPDARTRQLDLLCAAPEAWAAAGAFEASLAPVAGVSGLEPRPITLRLFLLQDAGRWTVLPGGLARVLPVTDPATGHTPPARLTKDVWVEAEHSGASGTASAAAAKGGPTYLAFAPLPIRRPSGEMPSRIADNFFWLGRYLERLEATARLLQAASARLGRLAAPTAREMGELRSLAVCLARAGLVPPDAIGGPSGAPLAAALSQAPLEGGALARHLAPVARLGGVLRDRLSGQMQSAIGQGSRRLGEELRAVPPQRDDPAGLARLGRTTAAILGFSATIAGLAAENMVRGGGWLFLDLGRRIERAGDVAAWTAAALREAGPATQPARLEPGLRLILELCDSAITYRSRYLTVLQAGPVLDLVLADAENPRSLAFQLGAMRDMLARLAETPRPPLALAAATLGERVEALVRALADPATAPGIARAPAMLEATEAEVAALSDAIARRYFAVLPVARSLGAA